MEHVSAGSARTRAVAVARNVVASSRRAAKGDSAARSKNHRHMWPSSMRKRSKYVPAGLHQNCGFYGISPKLFFRHNDIDSQAYIDAKKRTGR